MLKTDNIQRADRLFMKPGAISIRQAFNFAWSTFRQYYGLFTAIMLTLFGSWVALEIVVIAGQSLGLAWWLIAHCLFFVLLAGLKVGFIQICLALHEGRKVSFFDLFASLELAGRFLAGQAIYWAMLLAGLALFIVPGLYLGTRYALYGFYLVPKNAGLISSFQKSAALSKGAETALLSFLMIQVLLNILGASLFGLGLVITVPLFVLMMTSAYRQLGGI